MADLELTLQRRATVRETTLGELLLDGSRFCYTLEDCIREVPGEPVASWKVHGRTAIPAGRYRVAFLSSPKFGPLTPTLLDVPGFEFIRIHAGNDHGDTDGCILLGRKIVEEWDGDRLAESRLAVADLKRTLANAYADNGRAWLTILNP